MFKLRYNVTLQISKQPTPTSIGKYEVLIAEKGTGIMVPDQVVEAAVQVDDKRLLLFLTDDVPYEEALKIALLNLNEGVKEILTLGGAYLTGSFTDLKIYPDAVEFSFMGDTTWRVEIPVKPFIRLPFTGDPRGISRPLAFRHYIKISASPKPARADGSR
ncbi:hypothetical protein HFD91_04000 [Enterobacteriaceae bacterium EKM102V]|uniref:hypothetical protein n=1 Tax=Pantoea TaxID=53335 RepID=UPI00142E414F|nr:MULTISPECIES: hypothetical protein [Pantoea]KAF6662737.1 hypothetical protein HFD91_04000 [Enterobacteriaceae bacterium EKM102V]KAF6671203.1 hypothetical protein HFD97_04005 [Pantoea sp. EKM103V]